MYDWVIDEIKKELAKPNQFYPDWDMLKPYHERLKELEEQLAKPEQEPMFDTPESHIVKWSIPVDPNNFGEPLAKPEQDINILHIGTDVIEEGMSLIIRRGNEIIHSQFYEAPKRKWYGLSDKDCDKAWEHAQMSSPYGVTRIEVFAKDIERRLKERNNAV
jgi:hypothetical protein